MTVEWEEQAIVVATRPHGESALIATLLTESHGTHAGLVQGARRAAGALQPGALVNARWRARLADQLGNFTVEGERNVAALLLDDPLPLAALQSAMSLIQVAVPERQTQPGLFAATSLLIEMLPKPGWDAGYVAWELGMLRLLGFGLDLGSCAITGTSEDLVFVSPRSGRAVSRAAAEPWRDRLLALPGFLIGHGPGEPPDITAGLNLTGHFLERVAFAQTHSPLPAARTRFVESYRRRAFKPDIPDA